MGTLFSMRALLNLFNCVCFSFQGFGSLKSEHYSPSLYSYECDIYLAILLLLLLSSNSMGYLSGWFLC